MTGVQKGILRRVATVPFVVCVLMLTGAAVARMAACTWGPVVSRKEPIELRKPLGSLNKERLGEYEFVAAPKLSAAVEDALGTQQYLQWVLQDRSVARVNDPQRWIHLAVTYYTGGSNLAPHTPDVCQTGAGYQPKQAHENRDIEVPALGPGERGRVPVRICTFVKNTSWSRDEPTVVYTFHANGRFTATREGVRYWTQSVRDKHAYYSKVEISFGGEQCQPRNLGREESVAAATKVLNVVLPVLLEEHWPDWEATERPGAPTAN